MTNKTIEELSRDVAYEWCKSIGMTPSTILRDMILEALREQAAQTTLPSREEVFAWHKQYYDIYGIAPLPIEVVDWLRDNMKAKDLVKDIDLVQELDTTRSKRPEVSDLRHPDDLTLEEYPKPQDHDCYTLESQRGFLAGYRAALEKIK